MTVQIERYQTFSMKCDHRTRVSPNIISFASSEETRTGPIAHVGATDLDSDCLQTFFWLFYQFYNIENLWMLYATWRNTWSGSAMFAKSDKLHISRKTTSCNRCEMIFIQISPCFSCLTWVKRFARGKSARGKRLHQRRSGITVKLNEHGCIYTCVKNNFHIKILRSVEISVVHLVIEFVLNVPPTSEVVWRWGHDLETCPADWKSWGSNSGPLGIKRVDYISTTTQWLYMVMDINGSTSTSNCWDSFCHHRSLWTELSSGPINNPPPPPKKKKKKRKEKRKWFSCIF